MRLLLAGVLVLAAACARDRAPDTARAGTASHPSGISDDELAAFTRWQRDYTALFREQWEALDAAAHEDPSRPPEEVAREAAARGREVTARQAPVMQALLDHVPLKGRKAELAAEAVGGIFHFASPARGYLLVIARDEVRLEAARRRFGKEPVDDVVAREPFILAALQGR